jgi:hypothetical protein
VVASEALAGAISGLNFVPVTTTVSTGSRLLSVFMSAAVAPTENSAAESAKVDDVRTKRRAALLRANIPLPLIAAAQAAMFAMQDTTAMKRPSDNGARPHNAF